MILSAVIFILLCGVAYTVSNRVSSVSGTAADTPYVHSIQRKARVSANENLSWEINLGGSGNEQPVAVFNLNNEIYIFGNTSSSDLDFAGVSGNGMHGFGARLSLAGSTLEFTVFDFTIAKAVPTADGFAVAGNEGSVAGIYLITRELVLTAKAEMSPATALTACGLYIYDNRYFLFAESVDTVNKTSLLMHVYTVGLSLERERLFTHTYGLHLIEMLPYGNGYMLAANAEYQDYGYLSLIRFDLVNAPAYTDISLGYKYTPTGFVPISGGYAAVCDRDGNCELLTVTDSLVKNDVKFLTETPNGNKKSLFYADGIYAYSGEKIFQISESGMPVGSLDFDAYEIADFGSNGNAAFIVGLCENNIKIVAIGKEKSEVYSLKASHPAAAKIYAGASGIIFAATSDAVTSDCGYNFGGSDVWAGKFIIE